MIEQSVIERVLDAADIVEVVSDFVSLRKRGANYVGLCPFHNEKTPSFSVSPARGICHCFSCGKGGNVIHFLMEHEQLSFTDAVEWLGRKYGIPIPKKELTEKERSEQSVRESLYAANAYALDFFKKNLPGSVALRYLRSRGLQDSIIEKFQLGYSPDVSDALAKAATHAGYNRQYLIDTGLVLEREQDKSLYDRFRGRVIYPVFSLAGKVAAFGGRIMQSDAKAAKYVNSPESAIYSKRRELYGLYQATHAISKCECCYLVEGYMDVISMHQAGVENVVASSGTSLTTEQIRLIRRFTKNITVLYDGDSAGIKASLRGIDMLLAEGMNIHVLLLPDGEDPDSYAQKFGADAFQRYVANNQTDFIRFKTDLLLKESDGDPIRKVSLIKDIVNSISVIEDSITRSVYIKMCSSRLDVQESLLIQEVNKLRREALDKQKVEKMQQNNAVTLQQDEKENTPIEELRNRVRALLRGREAGIVSKERQLMQLLVHNGSDIVCKTCFNGQPDYPLTVGEFIVQSLLVDNLELLHPVYRNMLELFKENSSAPGFMAERFFMSCPDNVISKTVADLLQDTYMFEPGSDIDTNQQKLFDLTQYLMTEYKYAVVQYKIKELAKQMEDGSLSDQELEQIQIDYKNLLSVRVQLTRQLGNRVVNL